MQCTILFRFNFEYSFPLFATTTKEARPRRRESKCMNSGLHYGISCGSLLTILLAQRMQRKEQNEEEERAFGTYASAGGKVLTYRVRKQSPYGGYKIVSKKVDDNLSREKLLEERCKHKSDRMCM